MAYEWKMFIHYFFVGNIYNGLMVSYYYSQVLTLRSVFLSKNSEKKNHITDNSFFQIWGIFFIPLLIVVFLRVWVNPTLGTIMLHIFLSFGAIILFRDSIRRKLSVYIIFIGIQWFAEYLSMFSLSAVIQLVTGKSLPTTEMNTLSVPEMVLIDSFLVFYGILFSYKCASVLHQYSESISLGNIALLFTPGMFVPLGSGLPLFHEHSSALPILAAIYFFAGCFCFVLVLTGLRNLERQETKYERLRMQSAVLQQQLNHSRMIEDSYRIIRRQKHDTENQLLSIAWMMQNGHYNKAAAYIQSLKENKEKSHNE